MSGVPDAVMAPQAVSDWVARARDRRAAALTRSLPLAARVAALDALSSRLLRDATALRTVPGIAFLSGFLSGSNLDELIRREVAHPDALDRFVLVEPRKSLRLVPRGVVCHWIAGNVPLLGMFSWALSALAGNVNVIRLSSRQDDFVSPIVELLAGSSDTGARIAADTIVLRFDRDDDQAHRQMSEVADVRIAWGGQESVAAIASLPASWECETIVFGPRVSLAVIDPALATGGTLGRLVTDIVYFDQLACSSPQRVFVKGSMGEPGFEQFVDAFREEFERQCARAPRQPLNFGESYRIELDRARVLLEGGRVHGDAGTSWTVAVSPAPVPAVTCMNRFVEIVPFTEVAEAAGHVPAQVQTVVTLLGRDDLEPFSELAAGAGVCRFPRPGEGNGFENPWDGTPLLSRLTRWVTRTEPRG